ncbi:MAG: hypothetical protein MK359_07090 [SAR202 cluster bacterium]|nr:hypothetical protein [SAR202 cluster bacterium]
MGDDESSYLAEHILNFFGYSDRIIDNVLHPEDRDTFYMLEDAGLMETEREETTLYDGREWRIHYWLLKIAEIQRRTDAGPKYAPDDQEPSVYDEIPDDIWSR